MWSDKMWDGETKGQRVRWGLAILVILMMAFGVLLEIREANAQDISVCRDPDYDWPRFIFSGLPESWDGFTLYWSAEGATFEGTTLIADAKPDGYASLEIVFEDGGYFDWHAGPDTPYCGAVVEDPVETVHLGLVAGSPHGCYLAYISNGDGGSSLVTDNAHPDGIVWRPADDGTIHLITGGGGQSAAPEDYSLRAVPCQ
jgi:hypothetical protein